ncbi:MAG: OmpH family outer membrane protein [Planctomycetes bacterium]|nr:OmpH family outer membrane protein [Planctomycetota bacterium]
MALLFAASALAISFSGNISAQSQDSTPSPSRSAQKFGFVDETIAMTNCDDYKEAITDARRKYEMNMADLAEKNYLLKALREQYESCAEGGPKQRDLQFRISSLNYEIKELENWYNESNERNIREIRVSFYKKILLAIAAVARRDGYTAVYRVGEIDFRKSDPSRVSSAEIEILILSNTVMYFSPEQGVDLTETIVAELNK